ncbi:unnamed protein product, partial [marine sediment metagenome]
MPLVLQIPIAEEDKFYGLIDIIEKKAFYWEEETLGATYKEAEIPENYKDIPTSVCSLIPFSIAGINCLGIVPSLILFLITTPLPLSVG